MPSNPPNPDDVALDLRPLAGSERAPAAGFRTVDEPVAADETLAVTLVLRRAAAGQIGAAPADVAAVTETLSGLGLADPRGRRGLSAGAGVRHSGPPVPGLRHGADDGRKPQLPTSVRHPPSAQRWAERAGRAGRDRHRGARPGRPPAGPRPVPRGAARAAVSTSYTPPQLGKIYRFPPGTDGAGQTVAIIELGGGFAQSELDTYFSGLGVAAAGRSRAIGVDGAHNEPGPRPAGRRRRGAARHRGGRRARARRAASRCTSRPTPTPGSSTRSAEAAHAIADAGRDQHQLGAERGRVDRAGPRRHGRGVRRRRRARGHRHRRRRRRRAAPTEPTGGNHADFPASSPHVLACGGTRLTADPDTGTISAETVWNDGAGGGATGGGVSDTFPRPDWQSGAGVPRRPAAACPTSLPSPTRDRLPGPGRRQRRPSYGGTSAVAPLWAALVARLAQATGKPFGLLNPRSTQERGRSAGRRIPRHHQRRQRRVRRGSGLGRLHRPGFAGRRRAAGPAEESLTLGRTAPGPGAVGDSGGCWV